MLGRILPRPLHIFLLPRPNREVDERRIRRQRVFIEICEQARLEVYWKSVSLGGGPSVILHLSERELLRFDCFGRPGGHCHVEVGEWKKRSAQRIWLPESSREDQVRRAVFEIRHNFRWYRDHHPLASVRRVSPNEAGLSRACDEAEALLLEYARLCDAQARELPAASARESA